VASQPSSILLICAERESAARLATVIQGPERRVVAAPYGPVAQTRAVGSQLIVIDRIGEQTDAVPAVRRFREMPELAQVPILCIAQTDEIDERVRLLEAGADDVMGRPFLPEELQARVDALLVNHDATQASSLQTVAEIVRTDRPRLVTMFSPKGGAGTTTLAVNTAVAIARRSDRTVAIVDLDLEWGHVMTQLNLDARFSVVELARDQASLDDPELVRAYGESHRSGLAAFGSPQRPDQGEMISQDHVGRLLDGLLAAYDLTIVDAGSQLDERSLTLFEQSDKVALLLTPEIPAVRSLHTLREVLFEMSAPADRQFIVLNHIHQHDMLRLADLERSLQTSIDAELLYDAIAYQKAVNEGVPVVASGTRSAAAARLEQVAMELCGGSPEPASSGRSRRRLPIGGRRKRAG
jgi:pilus assembly protein CpaE